MTPKEFREMRVQLGLSQDQLAKKLGVSSGRTVRRWELGERKISETTVLLLQAVWEKSIFREPISE
ncbi:hypothetical protein LCGC14_1552040 [marine sediment metagenome]|uniref:HTH cro/C1-type domain-containing protein n=1 Tax=marine sediment metagenome TaxID=412755 RepID=A0A0F9IQ23_9ZZZZ